MSVNNSHTNGGLLVFNGERILIFYDGVKLSFGDTSDSLFCGTKSGKAFLTTHRVVFISKEPGERMSSFSMPFYTMKQVEIEQPVFSANYMHGRVESEHNGGWNGIMKWKMWFNKGGAIDFARAMLKLASMAHQAPPPIGFEVPSAPFYEAPPPAYSHPNNSKFAFTQNSDHFSNVPPTDVYSYGCPPPYAGVSHDIMMPVDSYASDSPPQYSEVYKKTK